MTHSKVNHMFWELMYYHVWDVCAKSALTQYDNTCKCLLNLIICKCWLNYTSPKFSSLDVNLESLAVQDTHFGQCLISHTDEGTIVYSTYICPSLDKINM